MAVKLINVFHVPEDQVEEFLTRWTATSAVYARTDGFLETHMHRNAGVGHQNFNFINIATWASPEAFINAHKNYVPGEESIPGIQFFPAIYEEIIMTKNLLPKTSTGQE